MKPTAPKIAHELRAKLSALVNRGIGGEADSAKRKLARLEARYDWTAPCQQAEGDIFAGIDYNAWSDTARHLATFSPEESDLATFIQWAISKAAGVRGSLRTGSSWKLEVWLEAEAHAMKHLASIADTIRASFARLWEQFSAAGAPLAARRVFWQGLWDGMMSDDRAPGQLLPRIASPTPASTRGKRRLAIAPGVALHPYECALPLGRKIRLSIPIEQIAAELASQVDTVRLQLKPQRAAA